MTEAGGSAGAGGAAGGARDAAGVARDHALLAYIRWMTPESVTPEGTRRKTRGEKAGDEAALGALLALLADLTGRAPLLERAELVGLGLARGVLRHGENKRLESLLGPEPTLEKVRGCSPAGPGTPAAPGGQPARHRATAARNPPGRRRR